MDYQSEDEYNWYQQQRLGVKRYETILVGLAIVLLACAITYGMMCTCGSNP